MTPDPLDHTDGRVIITPLEFAHEDRVYLFLLIGTVTEVANVFKTIGGGS